MARGILFTLGYGFMQRHYALPYKMYKYYPLNSILFDIFVYHLDFHIERLHNGVKQRL